MRVPENSWLTSGADITEGEVAVAEPPESLIQSASLLQQATGNCTSLVERALTSCSSLQTAQDFYYLHCMSLVGATGRISSAMDSAIFAAQTCRDHTGSATNPVDDDLCGEFTDRRYSANSGDSCTQSCVYGMYPIDSGFVTFYDVIL